MAKKKLKKYQGKTGSSSVKDSTATPTLTQELIDKLEQTRINRERARLMDSMYGTPRDYTPKITQPKPNTTPGPMLNLNTMEINKQSREAKKGGAMKPITALDQVDKMYKAKYKK